MHYTMLVWIYDTTNAMLICIHVLYYRGLHIILSNTSYNNSPVLYIVPRPPRACVLSLSLSFSISCLHLFSVPHQIFLALLSPSLAAFQLFFSHHHRPYLLCPSHDVVKTTTMWTQQLGNTCYFLHISQFWSGFYFVTLTSFWIGFIMKVQVHILNDRVFWILLRFIQSKLFFRCQFCVVPTTENWSILVLILILILVPARPCIFIRVLVLIFNLALTPHPQQWAPLFLEICESNIDLKSIRANRVSDGLVWALGLALGLALGWD